MKRICWKNEILLQENPPHILWQFAKDFSKRHSWERHRIDNFDSCLDSKLMLRNELTWRPTLASETVNDNWWIVFMVWLTDERRSALFPAVAIIREPHHRESPTRYEQDLNLRRTWVHVLLNEDVQLVITTTSPF